MTIDQSGSGGRLLAVFPDEHEARRAVEDAERAAGRSLHPRISAPEDEQAALRAEMHEETSHSFVGAGNVGPFTKEMGKGLSLGAVVGGIVGAVVGVLLALALAPGLSIGLRLVIGLFVGIAAGSTLGFTLGGGIGARGPAEPLAAERGIPVTVDNQGESVVEALRRHRPIRLDVLDQHQAPAGTIETEDHRDDSGVVEDLGGKLAQGEGDWSQIREDDNRA